MNKETGIEYQAHVHLSWQDGAANPQQIAEWMHDNVTALNALTALEGSGHEREFERTGNVDYTAARLEAKLDLLLQWVGKLLLKQNPMPPVTEVVLGSQRVRWKCPIPLKAGQQGVISLYLTSSLPVPLILPVKILDCSGGQAEAEILHISDDAQDALDRTLFRYHRRALHARGAKT